MFDKLEALEERFELVNKKLSDPDIISDQDEFRKYCKENSDLTPIIEKYREYKKTLSDLEGAKAIMDEESGEMYDLAVEEYKECKEKSRQFYR